MTLTEPLIMYVVQVELGNKWPDVFSKIIHKLHIIQLVTIKMFLIFNP